MNQLLAGGCRGAGSGALLTASCCWAAAGSEKASKWQKHKGTSKAKPGVLPGILALRFVPSRFIVSSRSFVVWPLSSPRIRQTANGAASQIGERGENTQDALAHPGEIAPSRDFARFAEVDARRSARPGMKRSPPRGSGGLRKGGPLIWLVGVRGMGEASSSARLWGAVRRHLPKDGGILQQPSPSPHGRGGRARSGGGDRSPIVRAPDLRFHYRSGRFLRLQAPCRKNIQGC